MAAVAGTGSTLQNVTDNQKRWLVFGIALNKVLVTLIRSFVEQEVQKEYGNLQTSHSIHTQSTSGRLKKWPTFLKYENINGNDVFPRLGGGRYDYSKFDCRVTSHVDFAKLYVENHMARFNAFDEHCDASAVLALLGKVPVFPPAVQSAANDVRHARNAWAHCVFSDWDPLSFPVRFAEMEKLVKSLGLPSVNEMYLVNELKDWETKGATLCMNATIDADLQKTVQQGLYELKNDIDQMAFEEEVSREKIKKALHDSQLVLEELREKVVKVVQEQEFIKQNQSTTQDQISELKSEHEDVQRRITSLEDQQKSNRPQINHEIASCESDIAFLAARHDADTRQWLLKDFSKWFSDPGDSRAYVLLGDPGVGKSVMAGVLAQRSRKAGNLGAAFFCRHNDSTRNDPRCLLGTIASQLCECSSEYNSIMGGEGGIRKLLGNSNLGVQELFTKLLQEPLYMCQSTQRKLVVVDALDETQYESREDFLDLIMNRFPVLPHWLVFFITSRPENTVQLSLKKYNPCVRICAGNVEHNNFYQQHAQDIKLFLTNSVDFSRLSFSVDDVATKCNGSFLYAFYIAKDLNASVQSGKSFQLDDHFPGDFDNFLRKNFKRVFDKVGCSLFKKLFGCAITAPAPLPVSFISYVLQREKLQIPKQHVLDALSLFMVLSKTFTFLHSLIPEWLTDEDKARDLFIDSNIEANYLKDVIHEILFDFIREQSQDVCVIKPDLLDYVLRVGIRLLSGFPGKDTSETVFSCLTSFKYIQNRIQSKRIEIYSLIEDFKLAAVCHFHDGNRKEILLKVCLALERNIFVLLECPYLLHSCLQNASKVVQDNVVIPDDVSTSWLQCNWRVLPSSDVNFRRLFALSPDGKLLAQRRGKHILLFDFCSLEIIYDIMLERHLVRGSEDLEFSPDGKFLFFGRLDLWLSVETGNLEEFPQFLGNKQMYEWGSLTVDRQWIVVKAGSFRPPLENDNCCPVCLLNYLCLWAAMEIAEGQERTTICSCFPGKLIVSPPNRKGETCFYQFPKRSESTGSMTWLLRYRYAQEGQECQDLVPAMKDLLNVLRTLNENWCRLLEDVTQHGYRFRRRFEDVCRYCPSRINSETPNLTVVRDFIISHYSMIFKYQVWNVQTGKSALEQVFSSGVQLSPFTYLCHLGSAVHEDGELFSGIYESVSLCNIALLNVFYHCVPLNYYERYFEFEFRNAVLEVQNPPNLKMILQPQFINILPLVSSDGNWFAMRSHDDNRTVKLYRGYDRRNPVHVVNMVEHFSFTYDSAFFLYLTTGTHSLHSLSLATGTILTSVYGEIPLSLIPEGQATYRFQGDDEENIMFLKDFPIGFLNYFFVPAAVKGPMQATFASTDTILVLYTDLQLVKMKTADGEGGIHLVSKTYLGHTFPSFQKVRKGQFSPGGKLFVTHQGTKILLYRIRLGSAKASTVFEANEEFIVLHFTFSADSTLLLFCVRGSNDLSFFVWNVQKEVISASFNSPGLTSEDFCCCFSLDEEGNNKEIIICTEFHIEFWDHTSRPCFLLRTVESNVPYTIADKFTCCTVSPKNDLLAYCITDRILLCPLKTSTDQSIRQLPRAHKGKVEFCQFLRGNRYLISYGVDGTMFLWDLSEWKAVAFAKIAQGRESIVSMAVSAEGDKVVCVTSFGRLNVIKPCGLKDATLSKLPLPNEMGSGKVTDAFHGQARELTTTIHDPHCPGSTEDLHATQLLIEEIEFYASYDDNGYSDEDSDELMD